MPDQEFRTKTIEALEEIADLASMLQDVITALSVVSTLTAKAAFDSEEKRRAAKATAKAAVRLRGALNARVEAKIDALLSGDATGLTVVRNDPYSQTNSENVKSFSRD